MLEERIAELIQADIDGELGPEQRAEVTQALEQSEEARIFHSEMLRVARHLTEAPDKEPPWGLRRKIIESIELPSMGGFANNWFRPAGYGLAMAAGVVLALGVVSIAPMKSNDVGSLVGTMVNNGQTVAGKPEAGLAIEQPEINGQVWLKNLDEAWVVEFDLASDESVEVLIDLDSTGMSFGGFADQADYSGDENLEVSGGEVRVVNQGSRHFVLFLRSIPGAEIKPQEIGIAMSRQGQRIYQGTLQSRG